MAQPKIDIDPEGRIFWTRPEGIKAYCVCGRTTSGRFILERMELPITEDDRVELDFMKMTPASEITAGEIEIFVFPENGGSQEDFIIPYVVTEAQASELNERLRVKQEMELAARKAREEAELAARKSRQFAPPTQVRQAQVPEPTPEKAVPSTVQPSPTVQALNIKRPSRWRLLRTISITTEVVAFSEVGWDTLTENSILLRNFARGKLKTLTPKWVKAALGKMKKKKPSSLASPPSVTPPEPVVARRPPDVPAAQPPSIGKASTESQDKVGAKPGPAKAGSKTKATSAKPKKEAAMANINITISHNLSQEEALSRVKSALPKLASKIKGFEGVYTESGGTFTGKSWGQKVSANVAVTKSMVSVSGKASLIAKPGLEKMIKEQLTEELAKPSEKAPATEPTAGTAGAGGDKAAAGKAAPSKPAPKKKSKKGAAETGDEDIDAGFSDFERRMATLATRRDVLSVGNAVVSGFETTSNENRAIRTDLANAKSEIIDRIEGVKSDRHSSHVWLWVLGGIVVVVMVGFLCSFLVFQVNQWPWKSGAAAATAVQTGLPLAQSQQIVFNIAASEAPEVVVKKEKEAPKANPAPTTPPATPPADSKKADDHGSTTKIDTGALCETRANEECEQEQEIEVVPPVTAAPVRTMPAASVVVTQPAYQQLPVYQQSVTMNAGVNYGYPLGQIVYIGGVRYIYDRDRVIKVGDPCVAETHHRRQDVGSPVRQRSQRSESVAVTAATRRQAAPMQPSNRMASSGFQQTPHTSQPIMSVPVIMAQAQFHK
jgi:hypothetical protein